MFALLTHVMSIDHLPALRDWLRFMSERPEELVVVIGSDPAIQRELELISDEIGCSLTISGTANPSDLKANEPRFLVPQFEAVRAEMALLTKLDTVPIRHGHQAWMARIQPLMSKYNTDFATGCARPYLADKHINNNLFLTQMVSNNFLIISPKNWLDWQRDPRGLNKDFGRFQTEGGPEYVMRLDGRFGLRIANTRDFMVLHTQAWDHRMHEARQAAQSGDDVIRFLKGYEDDNAHPWERTYHLPRPGIARRIRIRLGALHRQPSKEFARLMRRAGARELRSSDELSS